MIYYNDGEGNLRKISKIYHINKSTGLLEKLTKVQDFSYEEVVRLLWSLVSDLPGIGYWVNDRPWSNTVPFRNYPE